MDDRVTPAVAVIVLLVVLLGLMVLGWRARQRRQATLPQPASVPADPGAELLSLEVFYVATTVSDSPLDRIAVRGLGFRARARVTVTDAGVVLAIPGENAAFLPAADISAVGRSTWTIDRVVERGGLVRVSWTLGDTAVDSFLRVADPDDPTELIDTIKTIMSAPEGARNEEK
ncbi:hypothetical protein [Marisediminicola sp. LYQ134]|uniref:PH-like domain-containing protein n=1 Tax=unclassified Marisediminicola TaxID=2618316 RepID=UPI00398393E1